MRWASKLHTAAAVLRHEAGSSRSYHAVQVHQTGGPSVLQYAKDLASLPIFSQQIRVSIQSIGVNFHDTYTRTGLYPVPLPFTVGCEASGIVTEVSDNVESVAIGDRVAFF